MDRYFEELAAWLLIFFLMFPYHNAAAFRMGHAIFGQCYNVVYANRSSNLAVNGNFLQIKFFRK